MYTPDLDDIQLLEQHSKNIYCKIDLLNSSLKVIDSLEGITTSGSISIDADSDVRRTYSSTIYLDKNHAISRYSESEWMDKYIWVYIGIKRTGSRESEIKWYSQGLYVFSQNGYKYSAAEHTLSISCVDLVSKLNDTLAGQLTGYSTSIDAGANIRNAIINTLKLAGFDKCLVDYWNRTVPYELKYDTGTTVWSILTELRDLYYPFEMYFDDDTFVCKQIPSGYGDPVVLDNKTFDNLVVQEDASVDYSQVRNCVEVFGATVEPDYYAASVSYSATVYTLSVSNAELVSGKKFSFLAQNDSPSGAKISISNTVSGSTTTVGPFLLYRSITDQGGNDVQVDAGVIKAGKYYVVKYDKTESKFYFMGQQQIHAMVKLVDVMPSDAQIASDRTAENCDNISYVCTSNPEEYDEFHESRFSIERIGRRNKVLSGGDYENYVTDESCLQVAEYEHWKYCRLTDSITITTVLVPWLTVNQKVSYSARYLGGKTPAQFIIKKISTNIGEGTMSITMSRYYPFYPYIVNGS